MTLAQLLVYGLAVLLLVAALAKRSNSIRARNIRGPVQVGSVRGTLNQTYIEANSSTERSNAEPARPSGDRVAWVIGIVGVLVAVAQLAHDVLAK